MGYVEKVLQDNESVVQRGKLHWIIFVRAKFYLLISIGIYIASWNVEPSSKAPLVFASLLFLAFFIVAFVRTWIVKVTTEIAVTNSRIICKRGFLIRKTVEMNMDKVESVDVDQSILGRILNFGTIVIRGTGAGIEPLRKIASPLTLRSAITAR